MPDSLYRQTCLPGSVIFREGEGGDRAYVIEQGEVEISALREGDQVVLARLGEGELFGEMALIDGQVRSATAKARVETVLVVISRDQVERKIESSDPLLNLFLKVVLDRLRTTNTLIELQRQGLGDSPAPHRPDRELEQVRERAMSLLELEQELMQAADREEFEVYFQPIVATRDGRTAGFEALIRWHHPVRGMVPPLEFITLAESTGLITRVGLWVLGRACSALESLQQAVDESLPDGSRLWVAVNLSAKQISAPNLVEDVQDVLERTGLAPDRLKLEVTESVLMDDPETAIATLNRLKALGLRIAVDDFGTGYSSLSYLHRFPIDVVKIDRSFVSTMLTDSGNLKIVRAITGLSKELGMQLVAEGVERLEELTLIGDFGCDFAQGYLFSQPLPFAEAREAVRRKLGG